MSETALKVEVENLSEVKRKLRVEVPAAEVSEEVDRAYRELGKKAKVKGFRPGKVPRSVLELYYRKEIEQEVSDALVRRSLGEALKEQNLDPINLSWPEPPPEVLAGQEFRYSVEVEINPEFTVENYLGLELKAPEVTVKDAEVEARLEEIRQGNAMLKPLPESRGAQEGDFVVMDYQAYFGGKAVEGGKGEGAYVQIGSGNFNADFERGLVGLTPGTETRITVDLPKDFANPLLAGKEVEFQVKVVDLREKIVPELDDTFAQSLGGNFQVVADLREAVREDIIKVRERERQAYLENEAVDQILAHTSFEMPPSLVQQEQESIVREQWERMQQQGMNLGGMDPQRMMEVVKPMAERRVRTQLLLGQIATQEGIEVDDAEVEATLARIAVGSGQDVNEVKKYYQEHDFLGALRRQLYNEKSMKLLLDKAEVTNAPPATGEEKDKEKA
jgi:trigger factor